MSVPGVGYRHNPYKLVERSSLQPSITDTVVQTPNLPSIGKPVVPTPLPQQRTGNPELPFSAFPDGINPLGDSGEVPTHHESVENSYSPQPIVTDSGMQHPNLPSIGKLVDPPLPQERTRKPGLPFSHCPEGVKISSKGGRAVKNLLTYLQTIPNTNEINRVTSVDNPLSGSCVPQEEISGEQKQILARIMNITGRYLGKKQLEDVDKQRQTRDLLIKELEPVQNLSAPCLNAFILSISKGNFDENSRLEMQKKVEEILGLIESEQLKTDRMTPMHLFICCRNLGSIRLLKRVSDCLEKVKCSDPILAISNQTADVQLITQTAYVQAITHFIESVENSGSSEEIREIAEKGLIILPISDCRLVEAQEKLMSIL